MERLTSVGTSLVLALVLCGTAFGQQSQQTQVSGTVTSGPGQPLRGVTVRVQGAGIRTSTDAEGRYSLTAPADGVLTFGLIGYRAVGQAIAGRTTIDVVMEQALITLPEVVVTGYTAQRRGDITGAVSTVNVEGISKQTSASVLQRLDGRIPGVTVDASGSPGSRSTVRIRGISSFQNNDPLYIIDGTPVDGTSDSFLNWLSSNDLAEVQVLKDASATSIYGSRASNGVVIIETRKGTAGGRRVSLDVRTGVAAPVRGYDDFLMLDALQYFEVVKRSYCPRGNAACIADTVPKNIYGNPNSPTIPAYIYADAATVTSRDAWQRPLTINESQYFFPSRLVMPGSAGTNWWDAVFSPAQLTDANLSVSGGSEDNAYSVSFNYFDQNGTAAYNRFQRGSVRINTTFNLGRVTFGENVAFSRLEHVGGLPDDPGGFAEGGVLGKNILMQPVVPVYDIRGNFASGKATTLGNQSNPLKFAWARQFDVNTTDRMFGNVFAGADLGRNVSFKTRFGFNLGQGSFKGFTPITPENQEPGTANGINEDYRRSTDWTWTNTLNYVGAVGRHNVAVLVGQEANENTEGLIRGSISGLLSTELSRRYITDALGSAATKNVSDSGSIGRLLSVFGKADYNYAERYYLTVTLRRDGSSRLGPTHRWGTFPAFNAGWRLSREPFLAGSQLFSNIMLRFGWGVTGNQRIPTGRTEGQFGGTRGDTFYDIGGTGTAVLAGFRQSSFGNADLKWEESKSVNVGLDLEFLEGKGSFMADLYQRTTDNLLFDPPHPATAGVTSPAIVNIGEMRNRGIDVSIGYSGRIGAGTLWSVTLNGSHYRNTILRIDGASSRFFGPISTRVGNAIVNEVGAPIGSFYGLVADGYFPDAADTLHRPGPTGACTRTPCQDGAAQGRIRFRDLNGDGRVTAADRTIIGSPHPDFTAGLDLVLRRGAWDLSLTLFGTFGNDIFDAQKDFYVFRDFDTNVRTDLLANSWCAGTEPWCVTPGDPNAKYPRIDLKDTFSKQISSYYVEDGSYIRLRSFQIGYTIPPTLVRWMPAGRIYLQAENLFTITGYDGLDPALPAANTFGPAGDIRDQYRGVDRGSYPSNRTISLGVSTTF
jgi:TonB-dependent starch-binding outer membrane protein SusC